MTHVHSFPFRLLLAARRTLSAGGPEWHISGALFCVFDLRVIWGVNLDLTWRLIVVGMAWGEAMKQSVAEWGPWRGPSADEARKEDGTKARKMPRPMWPASNGLKVLDELRIA